MEVNMIGRESTSERIGRDDLFLLMESYKNTVELNTTLLERKEIISRQQVALVESINKMCENQATILTELKTFPETVRRAVEKITQALKDINDTHKKEFRVLREQHAENNKTVIREHAALNNRVYVAFSGMAAIIIALIGIIIKIL